MVPNFSKNNLSYRDLQLRFGLFLHLSSFEQLENLEFQNIKTSNKIFGPQTISNERVVNHRDVDLVRVHVKNLKFKISKYEASNRILSQ